MRTWTHDRYEAEVARHSNETSEATFERIWGRIVTYQLSAVIPSAALRRSRCDWMPPVA